MNISNQEILNFKNKLQNDRFEYFQACKNNYKLYTEIAQIIFSEIYKEIQEIDHQTSPYEQFVLKANDFKQKGFIDEEIELLERAIKNQVYIPGIYERLAIIYSKENKFELALNVCEKWFLTNYWKLPNMASTSQRLLIEN